MWVVLLLLKGSVCDMDHNLKKKTFFLVFLMCFLVKMLLYLLIKYMDVETMKEKNNQVIDQVNTHSDKLSIVQDKIRSKTPIPGTVATDNSDNSSLTTKSTREIELKKLVSSLKNQCQQLKTNCDNGGGQGRGRNGRGRGRGRFNRRGHREKGIKDRLKYCETLDNGRTTKYNDNKNMCHTNGWDIADGHTSETCRFPNKNHEFDATANNPKGACGLYKRLSHKA